MPRRKGGERIRRSASGNPQWGFPPGLGEIGRRLRQVQEEGVHLANRLREEAVEALTGGGRAVGTLVEQAARLGDGLQHRIQAAGREVEHGVEELFSRFESELTERTGAIITGVVETLRREQDRLRDRLRAIEARVRDVTKHEENDEDIEELHSGLSWTRSAIDQLTVTARQTADCLDEKQRRIEQLERRLAEAVKEATREQIAGDEVRQRLDRLEGCVSGVTGDAGTREEDQSGLRERLTRLETRFVNATKEEAARAATAATIRETHTRNEARLEELTKELLARSIDLSRLRERLVQVEAALSEIRQGQARGVQETGEAATGDG